MREIWIFAVAALIVLPGVADASPVLGQLEPLITVGDGVAGVLRSNEALGIGCAIVVVRALSRPKFSWRSVADIAALMVAHEFAVRFF
jgi:hypothetical protein